MDQPLNPHHPRFRPARAVGLAVVTAALAFPVGAAREGATAPWVPSNVVHSGAATYDDHALASEIVAAVHADPGLNGVALTLVARDGRVTLSGSASDVAQAARAERLVREIAGEREVRGRLDIAGG